MNTSLARTERALPWLAVAVLVGCTALQRIASFDYWWQLRTGRLIAETGRVPTADPFSYTAPGAPWIDIHWLFQLALHGVYRLAGHDGVVLAKLALVASIVAVSAACARVSRRTGPVAALCLGTMLLVACDRFLARPELPSFLWLAVVLLLLDREQRRDGPPDAWLWLVLPVQLVWVNMHGLFALGIAVCAIYFAGELLRPLVHPGSGLRRERLLRFASLTLAAALLAFANPNGARGALYPLTQLGMIGTEATRGVFGEGIRELQPPIGPGGVAEPLLVGLAALLAALAFGAAFLNRRRVPVAHLLALVAFAILGLAAVRNLALFALVAAPLAVRNLGEWLAERPPRAGLERAFSLAATAALLAASAAVASGHFFDRIGVERQLGLGLQTGIFPFEAVEWIARERPPGRIAHHMADGGLLMARLFPDYQVMLDGRLEVYGPERFEELVVSGPEHLEALDARFGFGSVLVHHSLRPAGGLLWSLHVDRRWRLVSLDEIAALFVRVDADGSPGWPAVDLDDPALPPAQPDTKGHADLRRRVARANLFLSLRRYERALEEWRELARLHPERSDSRRMVARLEGVVAAGERRRDSLEARLRRGENAALLTELGELELEYGRLEPARRHYDRALELEPRQARACLARARLAESEHDAVLAAALYRSLAEADDTPAESRRLARAGLERVAPASEP